jgi:predicted negative regulator of RcsB-dependent stress response
MPYKIRTVKKGYKEPIDALKESRLVDTYSRYRGVLFGIVGLALFGAVAGLIFWQMSVRSERQGWALEAEASRLYRENPELTAVMEKKEIKDKDEHFKKALELYQKIVLEYPRTTAAPVAQFYIGNTQFELKNSDGAIEAYKTFLGNYAGKSELTPLVQTKLAYVYQQAGKEDEALKLFQTVMANDKAPNQDQAYYEVGRIYEAKGVKNEAIAAYEKASEQFKNSPWATEAQTRLALLKPPPPPAPGQSAPPAPGTTPSTGMAAMPPHGKIVPPAGQSTAPMVRIEKGPDGKMTIIPISPEEAKSPLKAPVPNPEKKENK